MAIREMPFAAKTAYYFICEACGGASIPYDDRAEAEWHEQRHMCTAENSD